MPWIRPEGSDPSARRARCCMEWNLYLHRLILLSYPFLIAFSLYICLISFSSISHLFFSLDGGARTRSFTGRKAEVRDMHEGPSRTFLSGSVLSHFFFSPLRVRCGPSTVYDYNHLYTKRAETRTNIFHASRSKEAFSQSCIM